MLIVVSKRMEFVATRRLLAAFVATIILFSFTATADGEEGFKFQAGTVDEAEEDFSFQAANTKDTVEDTGGGTVGDAELDGEDNVRYQPVDQDQAEEDFKYQAANTEETVEDTVGGTVGDAELDYSIPHTDIVKDTVGDAAGGTDEDAEAAQHYQVSASLFYCAGAGDTCDGGKPDEGDYSALMEQTDKWIASEFFTKFPDFKSVDSEVIGRVYDPFANHEYPYRIDSDAVHHMKFSSAAHTEGDLYAFMEQLDMKAYIVDYLWELDSSNVFYNTKGVEWQARVRDE